MLIMIFQMLKYALPPIVNLLFRIFGLGYKSKKRAIIGSVVLFVLVIPMQFAQIYFTGYDKFKMYASIYFTLANILSVLIVSNDGVLKSLFMLMLQTNATFSVTIITSAIKYIFGLDYVQLTILSAVVLTVLLIIAIKFCVKPLRFLIEQIKSHWFVMLLVPLIVLMSGILITTYSDTYFGDNPLFYMIIVCMIESAFFLYASNLYHNLHVIYNYAKETKQQELLSNEIEAYNKEVTIMKTVRHDARHHNRVLAELLRDNNVKGALEYLESYEKSIEATKNTMYCKNLIANAILRLYDKKYSSNHIDFSVVANIPEILPLENNDLCVLLSNVLENAYEACQKVDEVRRFVTLNAVQDDYVLQIEITNSTVKNQSVLIDRLPQSTKDGGGTGLVSIKLIAEKINGSIRLKRSDGVFTTQIIIPLY